MFTAGDLAKKNNTLGVYIILYNDNDIIYIIYYILYIILYIINNNNM